MVVPMGWLLYAAVLVLFASWAAVHLALSWTLAVGKWWRGLVALFLFPLAPWWGQALGHSRLATAWVLLFAGYVVALLAGLL